MVSLSMTSQHIVGDGKHSLSGDYLITVRDFALSKGISASTLLHKSNISLDVLLNAPHRIGQTSMSRIGVNLVNALDNPLEASIEYGRSMAVNSHGDLGIAIQSTNNLLEGGNLLVQYFHTRSNSREIEVIPQQGFMHLRISPEASTKNIDDGKDVDEVAKFFFDFSILINIEGLGRLFLEKSTLQGRSIINIDTAEPAGFPFHMISDTIDVRFNQAHFELCVPMEWMSKPFLAANSELATVAANKCEDELKQLSSKSLEDEVRNRIRHSGDKKPTLEELASDFFMSASTLQRRLRDLDTTYQRIKDEERLAVARELLSQNTLSVEEISSRLGFSDASNFTKAFKSWTGQTPKSFRVTN